MQESAMAETRLTHAQWRMLLLASFGGALEFYDFVVFGVFAATIGAAFFPAGDPLASSIGGYAGFAIGYLARPLGGLIMAHLGDRTGRKRVFVGSVLAMSLSTLGLGLLPGYATIGPLAPVLLLVLRLIQGFCIGGELPGAVTYVVETVPGRAGTACGVVFGCVNTGVLLATLVSLIVNRTLSPQDVADWGWRVGFILGGALGLLGYPLRRKLAETPAFAAMKHAVLRVPVGQVIRAFPVQGVVGVGLAAATAGFNGFLFAFLPGYLGKMLKYDPASVAAAQTLGVLAYAVALPMVAWLGDWMPRAILLGLGSAILLTGSWFWFAAAVDHAAPLWLLLVLAGMTGSLCSGVFAVMMADLYPPKLRYSGIALPYNISFTAFSGTVPLMAASVIAATGDVASPAAVMAGCAVLSLLAAVASLRFGRHIAAA